MRLTFSKMNGLGNDFIVIDDRDAALDLTPEAVAWFCDRHFGIGGDGLILVRRASSADALYAMLYYNADGSLAEMCGNGARCFVKFLVDGGLVPEGASSVVIETLGGLKPVSFTRDATGHMDVVTVDMGAPVLDSAAIPMLVDGSPVIDHTLDTPWGPVRMTAVSMGNPHAVLWVDDVETAGVDTIGPFLETHSLFPRATNVEFAQLIDAGTVRVRTWERGVGETLACGTGACAVTVAGVLTCRTGRDVTVELAGGDLQVAWAPDDHVYMTGSAAVSFTGQIDLPDED